MHGCDGCQELMLEHLYDLLDEADRQAFLAHLLGCPACQAALEKVRAQQQLLAAAARMQFPGVQFHPPAPQAAPAPVSPAPAPVSPTLLPVGPRLRRPVAWKRWAVAAGLLLALAGLGVPAYRAHRDYTSAEKVLLDRTSTVAEARGRLEETKTELARAEIERDRQIEQVYHEMKARERRLVVSGPRTVQPGAPTDYQVLVYDLNGRPAPADISARIAGDAGLATAKSESKAAKIAKGSADPQGAAADKDKDAKKDAAAKEKQTAGTHDLKVTPLARGVYRVRIPPTLRLEPGQARNMIVSARRKDAPADKEQVTLQGKVQLTAPVYLTHLTTDKPMYQPGEVVHFRSLTVDRLTLQPPAVDFHLHYTLTSPLGAVRSLLRGRSALVRPGNNGQLAEVKGPDGKAIKGVGAGEVLLEPGMPGGEYTLAVAEETGRFPPVQRKFIVNQYQKPRLDKKLDFNRSSYGPGDEVQARVTALRADGGPVADRPVEIAVNVDDQLLDATGKPVGKPFAGRTDKSGQVLVRFVLPKNIERGQASLSVKFDDGAVETIVRTIPVVLKKLQVEFFPEGGDLVAGLVNRVYFQARTPLGKPAQLTGTLLDGETSLPVDIATLHDDKEPGVNQGLGVFAFTPAAGHTYSLRIDAPAGVVERKPLPAVRDAGVVMSIPKGVFDSNEPIRVRVHSRKPQTLMVGAYCRGQLLDTVQLEKGQTEAVLRPGSGAGGVCRVTVFEELPAGRGQFALKPVAERLVYRHPQERLDVSIAPDHRRYVPGQKVNLSLVTTDENEKPKPAILMLAVVDRSVLTMADEKTARAMPTHFLLTTEVRRAEDLEYADFLIGQHPKAPKVLDLLLGTQGWRRFAEQNPKQFREEMRKVAERMPDSDRQRQEEEAERLLVMIGQSTPRTMDPDQEKIDEVRESFKEKSEELVAQHRQAAEAVRRAGEDPDYRTALATLGRYRDLLHRGRDVAVPVLAGLMVLFLLAGLVKAVRERSLRVWGFVGMAAACGLVLAVVARGPFGLPVYQPLKGDRQVAELAMPPAPALDHLAEEDAGDKGDKDKKMATLLPGMGVGGGGANRGGGPAPVPPGVPGPVATRLTDRRAGAVPQKKRLEREKEMAGRKAPAVRLAAADKPGANGRMDPKGGLQALGRPGFAKAAKEGEAGKRGFYFNRELPFGAPEAARMLEQVQRARLRDGKDQLRAYEPPLVVREYAHLRPTNASPGLRTDFTETLCWHPVLVLPDGKGNVSFDLCDSVTSFQATVFAHTLDGRLGAAVKVIESRLPFTLSPKVPSEVTSSDRIDVSVAVANNTSDKRSVQLALTAAEGLELLQGQRQQRFDVAGDGRVRKLFRLRPTLTTGTARVAFEGTTGGPPGSGDLADGIRESIRVVPDGFPTAGASSDLLETSATHKIKLPGQWIAGTLACRVDVYPSTLADLQKGLEGLLREPHGCFEQSSTSNYPNVLILEYLRSADKANPELERRVREVLARGYQKLTSFECRDTTAKAQRGYEWFGGTAPPHEALTAYGLLQFRDMAGVYDVDKAMLKRTQDYLMKQRDGKGGFTRNPRALDTFGRAPQQVTNAYIVWALTESGKDDMATELNALAEEAKKSDDPYFLSLAAISLANRDRKGEAKELLHKVVKVQKADGHLEATQTSITGSGGRDLHIETTALAVLGWLKTDAQTFDKAIRDSVKWIGQQRGGYGGFGSTQSTILALKALIAYTRANKRTPEAGEVRLFIGEKKVAELAFPAGVDQPLTLAVPNPEMDLKPGANTLRVEITGKKNIFPHTLSWSCRTLKPDSIPGCPLDLTAKLAKTELNEGDAVRLTVKVKNVSGAGQGMAVAIVGLPAGLIVPEDLKQMKEHCRTPADGSRPLLGAFEINGRELVLYWRDMAKGQEITVPIDLVARAPGVYRGPASRAYLYYNADKKHWIEPLGVTVAAKAE